MAAHRNTEWVEEKHLEAGSVAARGLLPFHSDEMVTDAIFATLGDRTRT